MVTGSSIWHMWKFQRRMARVNWRLPWHCYYYVKGNSVERYTAVQRIRIRQKLYLMLLPIWCVFPNHSVSELKYMSHRRSWSTFRQRVLIKSCQLMCLTNMASIHMALSLMNCTHSRTVNYTMLWCREAEMRGCSHCIFL